MKTKLPGILAGAALITFVATPAFAQTPAELKVGLDTVWVLFTGVPGVLHEPGFALVECGTLPRQEHRQHPVEELHRLRRLVARLLGVRLRADVRRRQPASIGLTAAGCSHGADNSPATGDAYQGVYKALNWTGVPLYAKFFFQLVFAGTAATIVSAAPWPSASSSSPSSSSRSSWSRSSTRSPATGSGAAAGWRRAGFTDFAGSTVVHSVGGWAALAGVIVLGPRLGKYRPDGKVNADSRPQHDVGDARLP